MQTAKAPVLVVLHLVGGNDALNTLVPYNDPLYHQNRPSVHVPEEQLLPIDNHLGFHPSLASLLPFWNQRKMAVIPGIGYANPSYSHFRASDIWETAQPAEITYAGWLAQAVREIDPRGSNVLTAVNFGRGLPRALSLSGVPVVSVSNLDKYGFFSAIPDITERAERLKVFARMYRDEGEPNPPAAAGNPASVDQPFAALRHAGDTGVVALKAADILGTTKAVYTAMASYPNNSLGEKLKGIAQIKLANVGTRIFYTAHGSFDLHALQAANHAARLREVSDAVAAFFEDLRRHDGADDVAMFIWSEFGRRVRDNGSGTDHGAAGLALIIGDRVNGGMYGEYPSLREPDLEDGNLAHSVDFRLVYGSLLENWLEVGARPITGSLVEQIGLF